MTDVSNTNGTLVNGEKIKDSYILHSGDVIMLGLKGPQFVFETEILNPTVLVEISENETTILEIPSEKDNDVKDNDEIIEEIIEEKIIENSVDILESNVEINSTTKSDDIAEKKVTIHEEILEINTEDNNTEILSEQTQEISKTEIISNIKSEVDIVEKEVKKEILPTEIIAIIDNNNDVINKPLDVDKNTIFEGKKTINSVALLEKNIWNLINYQEINHINTNIDTIQSLSFSSGNDNALIVSGGRDKLVKLWSVKEEKEIASFAGHKMGINAVTLSNDNALIASGGSDKLVKLWSVKEEKEIASFAGHKMGINAVTLSNDNALIASGGSDKLIKLWSIEKEIEEKSIKTDFKSAITGLLFHPNNESILCISQLDQKISLINLDTEVELFSFCIPSQFFGLTVISLDGSCFISIKEDKNMVIWKI